VNRQATTTKIVGVELLGAWLREVPARRSIVKFT